MSKRNGKTKAVRIGRNGAGIPPGNYVDGFALAAEMKRKRLANAKRSKVNPNKGISRIDQEEKRTHGWFVRIMRKGKIKTAFFADQSNGGKTKALSLARTHYQKLVRSSGPVVRKAA